MLFKKTLSLILVSSSALISCSDDIAVNNENENQDKVPSEVIIPVDYRYLTLNNEGYCGEEPSVSFIHKNKTIYPDYFKDVNGVQILCNPNYAFHFKDKVLLAYGSNWNDNGVALLEANSFKKVADLNIKSAMTPYNIEWLGADSVIVAGRCKDENKNAFIADCTDGLTLKRKLDFGFTVYRMKKIGNKLYVAGCREKSNGETLQADLLVVEIDKLHESAFKTVKSNIHLSSKFADMCIDKNGNLWFASDEGSYKLYCIDTKTDVVKHTISMPLSMSTLNELAYAVSNDGKIIYLRSHKAFYTVDVDNPGELDEPVYEYREHVGLLCDLKMTEEGNLLFVNQNQSCFSPSEVVEFSPK